MYDLFISRDMALSLSLCCYKETVHIHAVVNFIDTSTIVKENGG